MEQLPALSTVLCTVLLIPNWGAGLTVLQSPDVLAYVGETATFGCSFEYRWGSAVNVKWTRAPGVALESHHPFYSGRLNVSFQNLLRKREATLTLSELQKRDSGLYRCHVTIHHEDSGTGAGTELQVMERNQIGTGLTVLQSPAVLRASPGETVNLSCSFENRQGSVVKATWTIAPGVVLESDHPFYSGRLNMSDLDLLRKGEATLTLSEVEERDSGLYQCQISIHQGERGTGAGTELQVMGRNQSDTGFPGGRELCWDSGPLSYRAVISLSLVVLFSLGIILRLRPWSGKESAPVGCCDRELLYQVAIALGLLLILGLVATVLLKRRRAPPPSQPRQRQPKGHGSRGAEESESLHYAEIKIQTPGRREHTSNHAQWR
ncbi:uncharacterized protein LOC119567620 isoform X3 [Chelonia mydas]|uniref:uncharacterized protein LOC119567620 isoform X2 n=1 Tax=Chelonia mydas TaxID=8469 RepID=UPI001CA7E5B9|nr:uncharacterized protein LOC119567620 isoform X2 [Chelonia mydas]XP_043383840.1 uncharacterized protein LOC119567620 isoform X3 [Chelonia mydas]